MKKTAYQRCDANCSLYHSKYHIVAPDVANSERQKTPFSRYARASGREIITGIERNWQHTDTH
jgi:hypothetical protein